MSSTDILIAAAGQAGVTDIEPYFVGNTDSSSYSNEWVYATETNLYIVWKSTSTLWYVDCLNKETNALQWRTSLTRSDTAYSITSIFVNASGELYASYTRLTGTSTNNWGYITKLNSDGTFAWNRSFKTSNTGTTWAHGVREEGGYLYIWGASSSSTGSTRYSPYVHKINLSTNTAVWTNRLQFTTLASYGGRGTGLDFDGSGNIYISGIVNTNTNFVARLSDSTGAVSAWNVFTTSDSDNIQEVFYDSANSRAILVGQDGQIYTADSSCNVTFRNKVVCPYEIFHYYNQGLTDTAFNNGKLYVGYRSQGGLGDGLEDSNVWGGHVFEFDTTTFSTTGNILFYSPQGNTSLSPTIGTVGNELYVGLTVVNSGATGNPSTNTIGYKLVGWFPTNLSKNLSSIYSSANSSVSGFFVSSISANAISSGSVTVTPVTGLTLTESTTTFSWATSTGVTATSGLTSSTYYTVTESDKVAPNNLIGLGSVRIHWTDTKTFYLPDYLAQNDVVVLVAGHGGTSSWAPSGYTSYSTVTGTDTYSCIADVYYKVMGATPDTTISIPSSGNSLYTGECYIFIFRGLNTANIFDVAATTGSLSNGFSITPPSITPVTSGATVINITVAQESTSIGFPTNLYANRAVAKRTSRISPNYFTQTLCTSQNWSSGAVSFNTFTSTLATATSYSAASISIAIRN